MNVLRRIISASCLAALLLLSAQTAYGQDRGEIEIKTAGQGEAAERSRGRLSEAGDPPGPLGPRRPTPRDPDAPTTRSLLEDLEARTQKAREETDRHDRRVRQLEQSVSVRARTSQQRRIDEQLSELNGEEAAVLRALARNRAHVLDHNAREPSRSDSLAVKKAYDAEADRLGNERAALKEQLRRVRRARSILSGANAVGAEVVARYNKLTPSEKKPDGHCHEVSYERVNAALKALYGDDAALPGLHDTLFGRIWGNKNDGENTVDPPRKPDPKSHWFKIEEKYRGKGAAGALVSHGMATMVSEDDIWQGKLKPGAVLQTWKEDSDLERVRDGFEPEQLGHSFVFLEYARDASGRITGMRIADQGSGWDVPNVLKRGEFQYWVGANVHYEE